jgi:hypothetical protein
VAKSSGLIPTLVRLGAEVRLRQLTEEEKLIVDLLSHLEHVKGMIIPEEKFAEWTEVARKRRRARRATKKAEKRTQWTPERRQAVSRRMKRYWARRKAAQNK